MTNGFFNAAHPFTKLLLVLFLMMTSYLILFGLGMLVALPIFNIPAREVISIIENIDHQGNIALPFNTPGMYRGYKLAGGEPSVAIFKE